MDVTNLEKHCRGTESRIMVVAAGPGGTAQYIQLSGSRAINIKLQKVKAVRVARIATITVSTVTSKKAIFNTIF